MTNSGVYVLELNNTGKYYVGKSTNKAERIKNHKECNEKCSNFVKNNGGVNKVLSPLTPHDNNMSNWEKDETIARMLKHGYNNVRGWEFTNQNNLNKEELDMIKMSIMGLSDRCRKCGNNGHFANSCKSEKAKWLIKLEECYPCNTSCSVMNDLLDTCDEISHSDNTSIISNNLLENNNDKTINDDIITEIAKTSRAKCQKCKELIEKGEYRTGVQCEFKGQLSTKWFHKNCYSSTKKQTTNISNNLENKKDKIFNNDDIIIEIAKTGKAKCQKCKELIEKGEYRTGVQYDFKGQLSTKWFHKTCYSFTQLSSTKLVKEKEIKCNICNRKGHTSNNCYAKKDLNGYYIETFCEECDVPIEFCNCSETEYESEDDNCCFRCGRPGHYANNCYAKKHVDGYYIRD